MLLTIHDANLQKVAFVDNDKQSTLNYYDDTWTRNLETGSSTFEFTVFKKAIKSDTATQKTYNYLNEKAFVSFKYKGKSFLFSVMTVEEDEQTVTCYCENLNLELINEYSNPYKATRAMSFVEYCNAMDLLNFTHLTVGINEISDQKRTLEWEGQETKLARLLSLAKKFDAEIDFETHLNDDSTIKSFRVNVYHENDDTHQGVGRVRNDVQLTYGKNLKSVTRKIDKSDLYTMVRPYGKRTVKNAKGEEVEEIVTIGSLSAYSENNSDGVREFFQSGEALYAPIAAQMYPSTFTHSTQADQWIRKDLEVDSDNPTVIRAAGLRNLKKHAYPAITYEVDGFLDVEIGDTVRIYDDGFSPLLLVQARVSDQKISFTNPTRNKTTFANFKALENRLSDDIQSAFERLFEASKPYLIKLSTTNGVIFKNQIGESLVTPSLYRGGKPVVSGVTWRWSLDGQVSTGQTYLVRGRDVVDTVTLTVAAYIGNDEVAVDEISLVNVVDGKLGTPGTPGRDGRTPYLHTAWANNETGTSGFSLENSINKLYIGVYTDFEPADSTDPTRYKWTKIKGEKGDKGDPGQRGLDGLQGLRGEQGLPGRNGADGRTQYTHIAYSNSANGTKDFSVSASDRAYIGMYVDFNERDSTNPSDYAWTLIKGSDGANGVAGKAGADGRTPYLHIAYATVADGSQGFSTTDSTNKTYIGTYTDYTQADSTDYRVYKWTLIKGADGNGISNVTNYYLATTASTGITKASAGWTTSPQAITADKRYLWNYRVELYTNGTSKTIDPAIIGVHGEKGADGLDAAVNITCGFTQGFSDSFVSVGSGTITPTADGWATFRCVNRTSSTQRVEFYLPKPDGLTENQQYTFIHEFRNNKSTNGLFSYHVQDNLTAFWGNPSSSTQANLATSFFRIVRPVNVNGNTLAGTTRLVTVNINVGAGQTLDVEARISCYVGNYQGSYIPYQGGKTGPQGIQGIQGVQGIQGIPGAKGVDGRTQYTHIAYADNATGGGFSQTDQTKAYIGMYQDFNATDSPNPTMYRWTKWKGSDGANGVPGAKGADGRTPYIHFAYAESADGRTGFSTTQTGNKRYLGTYTDYTQADSTDPTRYNWVDMVGTVEVDHVNLVENSKITISSNVYGFETRYVHLVAGKTYYFLARAKKTGGTADKRTRVYVYTPTWNHQFHLEFNSTEYETRSVKFTARYTERYAISSYWFPHGGDRSGTADIDWYMVVESNVEPKHWSPNPNDFTTALNSKADQVLTQEQLNALNEKTQIHDAELKAKASMEALSDFEKAYNAFVKANGEAAKKSEADLIEAGRRIEFLTTEFGGLKELKTFIDTYMTSSNEGLIIGKNDASSTIKVSHDRISMFSAGKEVMYISQGVIHIDNGIFTASVQIGRFRTEQYHLNADMNVIRYVG